MHANPEYRRRLEYAEKNEIPFHFSSVKVTRDVFVVTRATYRNPMCRLDECVEFLSRGSADGDSYIQLDISQFDQEFLGLRALAHAQ